jgi:UPF0716 family protein affecting phage T7 exclusion
MSRRPAVLILAVCVLATVAAVVSFARGSWLGVVWVLLAGVTSNMGWYYLRPRGTRAGRGEVAAGGADGACGGGVGGGDGCAGCVRRVCR